MASITIYSDGGEQAYPLDSDSVTLGRGLESDIRLKDIKASRRHCQIVRSGQGFQCVDLNSGNGTYVNGVQIKQQSLSPGDKIQIGNTTIAFQDAAPAAARPARKAAPSATTKAAPAGRTPTAQIPTAPTRKITAKVDTVRPATGGVKKGTGAIPKAGTRSISKASTQPVGRKGTTGGIKKPGTTGVKKTTGRTPTGRGTGRATGRVSATERFHSEARKKKSNPVAIIIGVIGAALVIAIAAIIFMPGDNTDLINDKLGIALEKANRAFEGMKFDEAKGHYENALGLIEGNDLFSSRAAEIRAYIKEVETAKAALEEANRKFADFKSRFETAKDDQYNALWREGSDLKQAFADTQVEWLDDLQLIMEKIGKMLDTNSAIARRSKFQYKRNEVIKDFKLDSRKPGEPDWSGAIKEWRAYMDNSEVGDEDKRKATQEVARINGRANEEITRLESRAKRMVEDNRKAEALEMLKKERPRFEHTDFFGKLQEIIAGIDT